MRKAPVVLLTTLFALASGSALALGDRAKEKKTSSTATTTQSAQNPSGSGAPNTTSGMQAAPNNSTAGAATGSSAASTGAAPTDNRSQVGQNDSRCDATKYASKSDMPKDCLDKGGTGASASGSIQGQSGGK